MPHNLQTQVVTGSDLLMGDVIYLTVNDTWTRQLAKAEILTDEAHAQLRLVDAITQQDRVVGAYLADVAPGPAGPVTTHFREEFRATGPSNYAHPKQESV